MSSGGGFWHYILYDFRCAGQVETEAVEEFGDHAVGAGDDAQVQVGGAVLAFGSHGQDYVHAAHGGHFLEQLARAVSQRLAGNGSVL